jgi:hypothetical protein
VNRTIWLILILVLIAAGVFLLTARQDGEGEPPPPEQTARAELPPAAPADSRPTEPVVEPVRSTRIPLPALDESDSETLESASEVFGKEAVASFLVPDDVIRKVVVTVDNLPREKISMRVRAVRAVPGPFRVDGADEDVTLGVANFARYRSVVSIINAADPTEIVGHFLRFYPLMQEAYEELGYPGMSFRDRVIEVIDDLLAAPEVDPGVRLTRPKVLYEFADPGLERRSAGQKMLIRIGGDNAAVVKDKLRQIRSELVRRTR